eukprot:gene31895-39404_t
MTFEALGINTSVLKALTDAGYTKPTPVQAPQLKKMAAAVEPQLKTVGHLLQKMKAAESQQMVRRAQIEELRKRKQAANGLAGCKIQMVAGEILVRSMPHKEGAPAANLMAPKDGKTFLRGPHVGYENLFSDSLGSLDWTYSKDVQAADLPAEGELPSAIVKRADGVFFKGDATAAACLAGVNHYFLAGAYFAGLDYAVFIRVLYGVGAELPQNLKDQQLIRFAGSVEPFQARRRELYKSVRIVNGEAEYYFEPVFFNVPDMPPEPARLNFDEFVADMWVKGIRFGIDAPAVKATIAAGRVARLIAARRLNATPGRDAAIVEVSQSIHRSNAPREMANGRFDLHTFQNRFPQVQPHVKLLRKVPRSPGLRGYELSGIPLEPAEPRDMELSSVAGAGTMLEQAGGMPVVIVAAKRLTAAEKAALI